MDKPASRKQLTHDRILDTASGVLREHGFHGVGVADIMKRSGLTHGGFYAHFASRDALLAEALARAGEDSRERLVRTVTSAKAKGESGLRALVKGYLSDAHLEGAGRGCPVAALASEMPRQAPEVREVAASRIDELTQLVRESLDASADPDAACVIAAQLVGALQVARTFGPGPKARRHLAASRRFLLDTFDSPTGAP